MYVIRSNSNPNKFLYSPTEIVNGIDNTAHFVQRIGTEAVLEEYKYWVNNKEIKDFEIVKVDSNEH